MLLAGWEAREATDGHELGHSYHHRDINPDNSIVGKLHQILEERQEPMRAPEFCEALERMFDDVRAVSVVRATLYRRSKDPADVFTRVDPGLFGLSEWRSGLPAAGESTANGSGKLRGRIEASGHRATA